MSPHTSELYAASCNPSRKAKQQPSRHSDTSTSEASHPRTLPIQPRNPAPIAIASAIDEPQHTAPAPAKRGRKPGTMSRAARETQRKLNHSIIEKARRTKINDALATLRQLVPSEFGSMGNNKKQKISGEDEDDDEEDDGEYQEKPTGKKKPGKKEEKEKEFKLEILIRTVAYMEHLVGRVKDLEEQVQNHTPNQDQETRKRKREEIVEVVEEDHDANRRRLSPDSESAQAQAVRPRLPSISAWLPEQHSVSPVITGTSTATRCSVSPALIPMRRSPPHTYLPSPPSSTQFAPMTPSISTQLPSLSLGPTATRSRSNTGTGSTPATPEEESAATLLLNFRRGTSCSPAFLPTQGVEPFAFDLGPSASGSLERQGERSQRRGGELVAQTPSSILGLGLGGRI
ncbi:hypothetical protein V5O48_008992 [Marasmius crinis-equi]|uniref:BHLH domain-containing protein n=1 Tax=Marasmius crinis-equi TaxID=585013 RepID=A0ABR3FCJ4_9AGAR